VCHITGITCAHTQHQDGHIQVGQRSRAECWPATSSSGDDRLADKCVGLMPGAKLCRIQGVSVLIAGDIAEGV
jgi:hypothetical protein